MRLHRSLLAMLASGVAVAGAMAPAAAATATSPGWRVVSSHGPASGVWTSDLVTSGAHNAWAVWQACSTCTGTAPDFFLDTTTASSWTTVSLPSTLTSYESTFAAAGSASQKDTWLFNAAPNNGTVLRWNGAAWSTQTIPSWVVRLGQSGSYDVAPLIFGPKSAWVFSLGTYHACGHSGLCPDRYVARYNGTAWTKLRLPGTPWSVSALSQHDVWVLGTSGSVTGGTSSDWILMHWNGSRWNVIKIPGAKVPAKSVEYITDLAAGSPRSVWVQRDIERGTQGARTLYLLHWTGSSWHRVTLLRQTTTVNYAAPDGTGGVWVADNGPKPGYTWYFDHYSDGRWTRHAVPVTSGTTLLDVTSLTWIPGSRSLWATGNLSIPHKSRGIIGVTFKYGT